jgi:hypothetical protein
MPYLQETDQVQFTLLESLIQIYLQHSNEAPEICRAASALQELHQAPAVSSSIGIPLSGDKSDAFVSLR